MTNRRKTEAARRLDRLADHLTDLQARVREAIATEAGRVVGDSLRDLLTTALRGGFPAPSTAPYPRPAPARDDRWDDDPDDDWRHDEDRYDPHRGPRDSDAPHHPVAVGDDRRSWWAGAADGAAAARWWTGRTGYRWVGAALGLLTVAAEVVGNPVVRAALAVLSLLAELATGTMPAAPPVIL